MRSVPRFLLPVVLLATAMSLCGESQAQPIRLQTGSGLPVYYFHDPSSSITHLCVAVPMGKGQEPEERQGLSFLLCRLVLEIPDEDHSVAMLEMGTRTSCDVYGDFSLITLRTLSVHLEESLKIIAAGIRNPLFSGLRISFIKEQMELYRRAEEDETSRRCELIHLRNFFGSAGYGGSVFGTPTSVKAIAKKELSALHERCFTASNLRVAVVSDLPRERISALVNEAFRSLPAGDAPPPAAAAINPSSERSFHDQKEKQQTQVSLSFLLPAFSVENQAMGVLAETMLGKGIESRLWRLRSQERLAYSIHARFLSMREAGLLTVSLRVSPERRQEALALLQREIDELQARGITPEELETTQKLAVVDYMKQVENKDRMASYLLFFDLMGAGFSLAADFPVHLQRVEPIALNEYLRRILSPGNRSQVTIGPMEPVTGSR